MSRAPYYTTELRPPPLTSAGAIYTAVRVADRFASRLPTRDELMRDFGMSRATALRWVRAFKDARGLA